MAKSLNTDKVLEELDKVPLSRLISAIESIKKSMAIPAEPTKQQARAIEREIALLDCISKAFKETFKVVLKRKYRDKDDVIEALENIDEGVIDASFINQNMTDELYVDEL